MTLKTPEEIVTEWQDNKIASDYRSMSRAVEELIDAELTPERLPDGRLSIKWTDDYRFIDSRWMYLEKCVEGKWIRFPSTRSLYKSTIAEAVIWFNVYAESNAVKRFLIRHGWLPVDTSLQRKKKS